MIEDISLRAHGWPLHLHARATGDEELNLERSGLGHRDNPIPDIGYLTYRVWNNRLAFGPRCENSKKLFARADGRHRHSSRAFRNVDSFDAKPSGGVVDRHHRPAIGPAASECQVKPKSQLASLFRGEPQSADELVRKKRARGDTACLVIEDD